MRTVLSGTAASHGMALGRARLVKPSKLSIDNRPLQDDEVEAEIERLHAAIDTARDELSELRDKLHGALAHDVGEFIDTHSLLLDDPELVHGLDDMIRKGHYRASAALNMQADRLGAVFEAIDDPYLRSRREDIDQVIGRVMSALSRQTSSEERKLAARVGEILVASTIAPGDMAHLAGHGLLGIVAAGGSVYSHSAILARSLNLPMLVATHDALDTIRDQDLVLIDAETGEAVVHPTAQDLSRYRNWQREAVRKGRRLATLAKQLTRTRDGVSIGLFANAEQAADVAQARALDANGIGLYRTEFLFLRSKGLPSEDEQFHAYRDLILGMGGRPCTIRTLDLGADKADNAGLALRSENNPALGVRGVRLSLRHPAVLATQLRAILRASSYGPLRILLPMITTLDEIRAVRSLLEICANDLRDTHHTLGEMPDVGAMIEVPAAAIGVHTLVDDVDFFAIGTNDLTQYVLAADRNNDALGTLYDPLQPALLRLIARVIGVGRRARKPVSLCGEMAGDPLLVPLLLALGLTEFSMHPGRMLQVRDRIGQLERAHLRKLSPQLLHARCSQEVAALLDSFSPKQSGD